MDVLKHTPGILVQDNDISMLNKGKIIFLLNGREMNMDMKGLVAYLTAQSSDNLKQIEVMTIPPAKYSAEGSAGVINFVTKKQRNNFIGGNAANKLSVRKSVYDDASISLQYKQNKVEAYMNAGVGFGTMQSDSEKVSTILPRHGTQPIICINLTIMLWQQLGLNTLLRKTHH